MESRAENPQGVLFVYLYFTLLRVTVMILIVFSS
jgi:hypothetical protein